jgi:hypothetical protein
MARGFIKACQCLATGILLLGNAVQADQAVLLQEAVLVEANPTPDQPAVRATYMTNDGWAVTSPSFIDAAVMVFDFGERRSVSRAVLSLPLEALYPRSGKAPLRVFAFADDGRIDLSDYKAGSSIAVAELDAVAASSGNAAATLTVDVTGAVNAILPGSRFVGIRVQSTAVPADVAPAFPAWTGVKFRPLYSMEFTTGTPPALPGDRPRFDGYTLSVPGVSAPGVGAYNVSLSLVNADAGEFVLSAATDISPPGSISGSGRQGLQLLDCAAFTVPPGSQTLVPGAPAFDPRTSILDIPSMLFSGKEYAVRMQLVAGTTPMRFRLLSQTEIPAGAPVPEVTIAQFGGSLAIPPTQDFLPLCHGWVLIGDTKRNALVERNVITGETGATYKFNTIPDEMLLDADAGLVYFSTLPESERLYILDIASGAFTFHRLREGGRDFIPVDIALGEDDNVFTLLFDPLYELEENGPAEEGLWMGVFNPEGDPVTAAIPLLAPVRIEYDPVRRHVFLATESNLATFEFNPLNSGLTFVQGTDIAVGSGCTDFSISPDGNRLAYSCPAGNERTPSTAIVDMDPLEYYNTDGKWILENAPVSAVFDQSGAVLIATDGIKLYFFDVSTHLLRSSYSLGLSEGETVNKVRLSRDGKLVMVLLQNEVGDAAGRIHWVPLPAFAPL